MVDEDASSHGPMTGEAGAGLPPRGPWFPLASLWRAHPRAPRALPAENTCARGPRVQARIPPRRWTAPSRSCCGSAGACPSP
jgi:hypothetical protein